MRKISFVIGTSWMTCKKLQYLKRSIYHLIAQNKISVSEKTRLPTKASIKKIGDVLEGGDFFPPEERKTKWDQVPGPVKAFSWPVLMQSGGLAQRKGTRLELTKEGKRAAGESPEHTLNLLFKKWMYSDILDEFSRVDTIKEQRGKGKRYLLAFLMEYLATLGIVDLYYSDPREAEPDFADLWGVDELTFISRYDGLTSIKINGLGAWCLGCAEEYISPITKQNTTLTVMSNFEVVAKEMIMSDKIYLESFTRKISDYVYLLEQSTVLKALDRGETVESITTFLHQRSNKELPAPVSVFLSDIGNRSGAFAQTGDAIIIEAKDAEQLMMVSMDPQLKKHILCSKGSSIVVPEKEKAVFLKKMRDRGYVIS